MKCFKCSTWSRKWNPSVTWSSWSPVLWNTSSLLEKLWLRSARRLCPFVENCAQNDKILMILRRQTETVCARRQDGSVSPGGVNTPATLRVLRGCRLRPLLTRLPAPDAPSSAGGDAAARFTWTPGAGQVPGRTCWESHFGLQVPSE